MMVSSTDLRRIAGAKNLHPLMFSLAEEINKQAAAFGLTNKGDLARFLANVCVETQGFTRLEENLNYSAGRLLKVWPKRFPTLASTKGFAGNPQALANKVYGGRLGNAGKANAGWLYRGSGALQTTGFDNFAEVEKATGLPVTDYPDMLRKPDLAVKAALIFWQRRGLNGVADIGRVRQVINGGTNGLAEVKAALARAQKLDLMVPAKWPVVVRPVDELTAHHEDPAAIEPVKVEPAKPDAPQPWLHPDQDPAVSGDAPAPVSPTGLKGLVLTLVAACAAGLAWVAQLPCDWLGIFCK
jgi:putative chitinase